MGHGIDGVRRGSRMSSCGNDGVLSLVHRRHQMSFQLSTQPLDLCFLKVTKASLQSFPNFQDGELILGRETLEHVVTYSA